MDPLDVLSVAFPFAELDDEFQEDDDVEEGVQIDDDVEGEEEEERTVDKEVSESGRENRKREDTENEHLQVRI